MPRVRCLLLQGKGDEGPRSARLLFIVIVVAVVIVVVVVVCIVDLPDKLIVVLLRSACPLALLPRCFRCSTASLVKVPPDP